MTDFLAKMQYFCCYVKKEFVNHHGWLGAWKGAKIRCNSTCKYSFCAILV